MNKALKFLTFFSLTFMVVQILWVSSMKLVECIGGVAFSDHAYSITMSISMLLGGIMSVLLAIEVWKE